jgi:hypothetical protein
MIYILFGEQACNAHTLEETDKVIRCIQEQDGAVHKFGKKVEPLDFLEKSHGWLLYEIITKEEYELYSEQILTVS